MMVKQEPRCCHRLTGNVHTSWEDTGDINGAGSDFDTCKDMERSNVLAVRFYQRYRHEFSQSGTFHRTKYGGRRDSLIMVWEDNSDYDGDMIPDDDILMIVR